MAFSKEINIKKVKSKKTQTKCGLLRRLTTNQVCLTACDVNVRKPLLAFMLMFELIHPISFSFLIIINGNESSCQALITKKEYICKSAHLVEEGQHWDKLKLLVH